MKKLTKKYKVVYEGTKMVLPLTEEEIGRAHV